MSTSKMRAAAGFYIHSDCTLNLDDAVLDALYSRIAKHLRDNVEELHRLYPDKPIVRVDISFEPMERRVV